MAASRDRSRQTPPAARNKLRQPTRAPAKAANTTRRRPDPSLPAGRTADIEARIIESLADPAQRPLTVGARCAAMGIHRCTWYRHMEDPLFRARAAAAWRECCRDALGPVMQALLTSAQIEGREGHQDRKLLLELLGEYTPGQSVEVRAAAAPASVDDLDDAALLALFEGRENELPPGVRRRLGLLAGKKASDAMECAARHGSGVGGGPGNGLSNPSTEEGRPRT